MPSGACLCGAIQYEVARAIEEIDHCHCSMCRRSHGAAFATYGRVANEDLRIVAGESELKTYRSSDPVARSFCGTCGSRLFFRHGALPDACFVAIGSLRDDPGGRPHAHIFAASKADWFEIADDLPRHDEYPPGVADGSG